MRHIIVWTLQSNVSSIFASIKQLPTYLTDMSSFMYLMLHAQRLTLADAVAEHLKFDSSLEATAG